MKLGYARVSTEDQNLDIQRGRLSQAGCEMMFEEKISGTARGRPELERLMAHLRKDDVLVVARLDRLARSTIDLLHIAERIKEKQAGLQSLDEPWADTTSPSGVMIMTVFAGIAQFERSLILAQSARSCDFGHLGEHVGNGLVVVDDRPCEERRSAPIRERRYEPWRFEWGSDRLLEPEFFGHRVRDRQSGDGTTGIGGSA